MTLTRKRSVEKNNLYILITQLSHTKLKITIMAKRELPAKFGADGPAVLPWWWDICIHTEITTLYIYIYADGVLTGVLPAECRLCRQERVDIPANTP